MKYPPKTYAMALARALKESPRGRHGAILKNFAAMLRRREAEAGIRKTMEELEFTFMREGTLKKIKIISARPLGGAESVARGVAGGSDIFEEMIDGSLVAGIIVEKNEYEKLDFSLKGQLDRIFPQN